MKIHSSTLLATLPLFFVSALLKATPPVAIPPPSKVRIAISLTPWAKFTARGQKDSAVYRQTATQKYTLRAALDRSNHFYFRDWHITTRPLFWSKQTRKYKTELTVYQRFGKDKKIEERIGKIVADGTLKAYRDFYVLQNFQKKNFQDKSGNPKLLITTGFTIDTRRVATARK